MSNKNLFKYFISCGAVIYTAISALFFIIEIRISNGAAAVFQLDPQRFLYLLLFSYVISLGNTLFKLESLSSTTRRLLHAASYIFGLLAFLTLSGLKFYAAMIISAVFALFYVLVVFIYSLAFGNAGRLNVPNNNSGSKSQNKQDQKNKNQSNSKIKANDKKQSSKDEYKKRFS